MYRLLAALGIVLAVRTAHAESAKEALERCLQAPVTDTTVARTNPWIVHTSAWEDLLAAAQNCTDEKKWKECMGMNARQWPDNQVQADYDAFERAVLQLPLNTKGLTYPRTTAPSGVFLKTREFCLEQGRSSCMGRLTSNITYSRKTSEQLPLLWDAIDSAAHDEAARRRDDACHRQWDGKVEEESRGAGKPATPKSQAGASSATGAQQPSPNGQAASGTATAGIAPPQKSQQQIEAEQNLAHANATAAGAQAATQAVSAAAPQLANLVTQMPDIDGRIRGSFEATLPIGGFVADPSGISLAFPFRLQLRFFKWFTSKESFERSERQRGLEITAALCGAPAIGGEGAGYATLGARYWHGWFGVGPQLAAGGGSDGLATAALQLSAGAFVAQRRGAIIFSVAGNTKATEQYDGYVSGSLEIGIRMFGFSFRADKFKSVGIIAFGMKVVLPW
jgi:hypothetical protein